VKLSIKSALVCAFVVSGIIGFSVLKFWVLPAWHRHNYPYGSSHCCIKDFMALTSYAEDHNGVLPNGGATPEASLSMLYHYEHGISAETLRGKTVPLAVTEAALQNGGLLGPKSCGWH
jgi:hypothetical protein